MKRIFQLLAKYKWAVIAASLFVLYMGFKFFFVNNIAGYYHVIVPISGESDKGVRIVDESQPDSFAVHSESDPDSDLIASLDDSEAKSSSDSLGGYDAKMTPGRFWRGIRPVRPWEVSATFEFTLSNVRYSDAGIAEKITGSVRYKIEEDKPKFIALHVQYRNERNFRDRAVRQLVKEAVNLTASIMPYEASYTHQKAQFIEWVLDQLNKGVYLAETYVDTVRLSSGEINLVRRSRIKRDPKTQEPLRKEYSLVKYDVSFFQFVIDEPEYASDIQTKIADKLANKMGKVISQAKGELEAARDDSAKAFGSLNVIMAQYEREVKNVKDIVGAEMVSDTTTIYAEMRKEIAAIMRRVSDNNKNRDLKIANGTYEKERALQTADSNMDHRLDMWQTWHFAAADIIENGTGPLRPSIVLSQTAGSQGDRAMEMLNVQAAQELLTKNKK